MSLLSRVAAVAAILLLPIFMTSQENKGQVEVFVTRSNSSEGISEVQLTLQGSSPRVDAVTDSSGHFTFNNLAAGPYQIFAQSNGYFVPPPPGSTGTVASTATAVATVVAGKATPEVRLALIRGGTISGRIRDPYGQPASGADVHVYQRIYQNARPVLQSVASNTTDDSGVFRIFWLLPGQYDVAVIPTRRPCATGTTLANQLLARNPPPLCSDEGPQDTAARTFFPSTVKEQNAARITITEGAEITGIDIDIRDDAKRKISGTVISSLTGPNVQQPRISTFYLVPRDSSAFVESAAVNFPNSAADWSNGHFEIRGILPGSYDLITTLPAAASGLAVGHVSVEVGEENVENVTIHVEPGPEVKARLLVDGRPVAYTMATPFSVSPGRLLEGVLSTGINQSAGPPTGPVPIPAYRLMLRSLDPYAWPLEGGASLNTKFNAAGWFTFPSVPEGRYFIRPTLPLNGYIADVRAGGKSVYDDGFAVAGSPVEIQVDVKTTGAEIHGSVHDNSQKAVANARVVLAPAAAHRQNIALYKTAVSDAAGRYTLNGVAPGEYKLFAWQFVPANAWMNAEFMTPDESRGQTITVTIGSFFNADVKVIPAGTE